MKTTISSKLLYLVQRNSHNIQLRNFLNKVVGVFLPSANKRIRGLSFLNTKKSEGQILADLHLQGYSELGVVLDETVVAKIKKQLETLPCYKTDEREGTLVDFSNLTDDIQLGNYERKDLLAVPEITSLANDEKILNVVAKYFGVKPTISNINSWWSFARRQTAKEAQFFHRDVDDFKFVKLFVYLTDVTADSGPHVYVKGSHKKNTLIELKRFKDEEVESSYPAEDIISFERPSGSCFIVDTYGIHKGLLPLNANRLMFQVQYSYLPLYGQYYQPIEKTKDIKADNLDPYVNRLLFNN